MFTEDDLIALDRLHVWRPYTSSEDHEHRPLFVVDRAEGPWLIAADGRRVLDASGSWWCNNLGHGHPRLRDAIRRQSERLMHCTFAAATHEPAARLAAELIEVAPSGLDRVFYSDNGSTAVEVALKIAFQYWQQNGQPGRRRFVALPGAYHGDTIGAMSAGPSTRSLRGFGRSNLTSRDRMSPSRTTGRRSSMRSSRHSRKKAMRSLL